MKKTPKSKVKPKAKLAAKLKAKIVAKKPIAKKKPQIKPEIKPDGATPSVADLTPKFDWDKVDENEKTGEQQDASKSDDYLKNVEDGPQTLLNTKEFVYYSYYARIKEKLRQHWESKIKDKIARALRQGRCQSLYFRRRESEEKYHRLRRHLDG